MNTLGNGALAIDDLRATVHATPGAREIGRPPSAFLFWALVAFLILEYVRPPVVSQLKLQMAFIIAMPLLWATANPRPWTRNMTFQIAMVAYLATAMLHGYNNFNAYKASRLMYGTAMVSLAITWLFSFRKYYTLGVASWVAIMCYQALHGLTHSGTGTGGWVGDENDLALGLCTALPFVFMGVQMLGGWRRWLCAGVMLLLVSGIVVSFSRGGFLGMLSVVLYCILLGKNRLRNIGLGISLALLFYMAIPSEYKEELESIREVKTGTAEGRFFLWTAGTRMWQDSPLLGVGPMCSGILLPRYTPAVTSGGMFASDWYQTKSWYGTAMHSIYFEILAELGIIGYILFGGIVYGHFTGLRRTLHAVRSHPRAPPDLVRFAELNSLALGGAVIAFLSAGAFLSVTYYPYIWYFTAMGAAFERLVRAELPSDAPAGAE